MVVEDEQLRRSNERVQALSEHIEKLMVHLKHEAAAKAKAVDSSRKGERQVTLLKSRNGILARRNKARERVVVELREGARILEDQLRLMDEKYIELREKLDWTRAHSRREVRRIQQEANALRAKWALATTTCCRRPDSVTADGTFTTFCDGRSPRGRPKTLSHPSGSRTATASSSKISDGDGSVFSPLPCR